jgi:GH35 family endo-1,4-beta-xylanase
LVQINCLTRILALGAALLAVGVNLTLLPWAIGQAQTSAPSGGTDVLGTDTFMAFDQPGGNNLKLEVVSVIGQRFDRAWRVTSIGPFEMPWSAQMTASNRVAINKGDALLVQFWARQIGGGAQTEFVFEMNQEPWEKSIGIPVQLTEQWVLYSVPFRAGRDFSPNEAAARFRLGYANQTFELGGVLLKNYARSRDVRDLPFTGFDYAGRSLNASWRAEANARIDRIRKADARVRVLDAQGQPVSNASVRLSMKHHAFPFGSAVDAERLLGNSPDSRIYKQKILEMFNRVVLENDLKWPTWECCRRNQALEALKFFRAQGISVRGHNLIWPCEGPYCLPDDVPPMFSDVSRLRARIDQHPQDILGATRGQVVEWDVVNEPSANKRLAKVLGEEEMVAWFKRVKALDPTPKLFLNDYGNLGEGTLDVEFKRIIKRMLELGAPLEGIGLQAHFSLQLTPPVQLFERLNSFAAFGLPLAITEFDVNTTDERLQADYLRDFLTVAFSHPAVSSFLMWGFWAGQHWLPDAALYRQDWSLKPNGRVWRDLVLKTWWTNAVGQTSRDGVFQTRCFLGEYEISATANGKTVTQRVRLGKPDGEFTLRLP